MRNVKFCKMDAVFFPIIHEPMANYYLLLELRLTLAKKFVYHFFHYFSIL